MAEITRHLPGTFCWVELGTTNALSANRFYSQLFGWRRSFMPLDDGNVYTMLQLNGRDVGAMFEPFESNESFDPHWRLYIATTDIARSVARAVELGGRVLSEPREISDGGRMAIVQDPTGATFALWEAREHIGAEVIKQSGALAWQELATTNIEAAKEFYAGMFGWTAQTMSAGARVFTKFKVKRSDTDSASLAPMAEGEGTSHWQAYFAVEDCERSVRKAVMLGAQIKEQPTYLSGLGRRAVLTDPEGAVFSLLEQEQAWEMPYAMAA